MRCTSKCVSAEGAKSRWALLPLFLSVALASEAEDLPDLRHDLIPDGHGTMQALRQRIAEGTHENEDV